MVAVMTEGDLQTQTRLVAGAIEAPEGVAAGLVGQGLAVVVVPGARPGVGRSQAQRQGLEGLAGVLAHGSQRQGGPAADENRNAVQGGGHHPEAGALVELAGEPVLPAAGGEVDHAAIAQRARHRGHQQVGSQHVLVEKAAGGGLGGVGHRHRAHDRQAGLGGLAEDAVKVRQEPVAPADRLAAERLGLGAEGPGLLVARAEGAVVAEEWREGPGLGPAHQELGGAVAAEAADVRPHEGHAGQAQVQVHRQAHLQVAPHGLVVAGPDHRVALDARVARAADHEGPLVGAQPSEPLPRGLAHAEAVEVVGRPVRHLGARLAVDGVVRHRARVVGRVRGLEQGGLVHVAPDAGDAGIQKPRMPIAPPGAGVGPDEVREDAVARPDLAHERGAVGVSDDEPPRHGLVMGGVTRLGFDAGVDDGDGPEALVAQPLDHLGRPREALGVPGEDLVGVHVVDVEVDHVGGNAAIAELGGDRLHRLAARVAPARLMKAQRPQGRHRHAPSERRIARHHLGHGGPGHGIEPKPRPVGFVAPGGGVGRPQIEAGTARVVEQEARMAALMARQHERNRLVELVVHLVVDARVVGVPHRVGPAAPIQVPRLLAQPEAPVLWQQGAREGQLAVGRSHGDRPPHGQPLGGFPGQGQRLGLNPQGQARCGHAPPARHVGHDQRCRRRRVQHGRAVGQGGVAFESDGHGAIAPGFDAQAVAAQAQAKGGPGFGPGIGSGAQGNERRGHGQAILSTRQFATKKGGHGFPRNRPRQ
ncbi:hypothetical protein D3C72_604660 [compost metagenome]